MAKASKAKRTLLRGYTRLSGSSKRVRTPTGSTISDRAYNKIVNEHKVLSGKKVTSKRGKAVREYLVKQGKIGYGIPRGKKRLEGPAIKRIMDGGYRIRIKDSAHSYQIFSTYKRFEDWFLKTYHHYGDKVKLRSEPEYIKI